jgi:hypothetical protein
MWSFPCSWSMIIDSYIYYLKFWFEFFWPLHLNSDFNGFFLNTANFAVIIRNFAILDLFLLWYFFSDSCTIFGIFVRICLDYVLPAKFSSTEIKPKIKMIQLRFFRNIITSIQIFSPFENLYSEFYFWNSQHMNLLKNLLGKIEYRVFVTVLVIF